MPSDKRPSNFCKHERWDYGHHDNDDEISVREKVYTTLKDHPKLLRKGGKRKVVQTPRTKLPVLFPSVVLLLMSRSGTTNFVKN